MIREYTGKRSLASSLDWWVIICYLLLVIIGLANIYSSIHSSGDAAFYDFATRSGKQLVWIGTAIALAALILFVIPPRIWEGASLPIYVFVLFLLVAVVFLGIEVKGSRSWFAFGPVRFQPAEISKISTALLVATIMGQNGFKLTKPKNFLTVALAIVIPMCAILFEKETGSMLVYLGFAFVLYREGLTGWLLGLIGLVVLLFIMTLTYSSYVACLILVGITVLLNAFKGKYMWRWLLFGMLFIAFFAFLPRIEVIASVVNPLFILLGAMGVALVIFLYKSFRARHDALLYSSIAAIVGIAVIFSTNHVFDKVLGDHQQKRIQELLGIIDDPIGVGYNVNQSMIAIGSGGFSGKGFLNGTQTTYGFVPEQSTDFIFCTVGEEWGFMGCLAVICLYLFLIVRLVLDAEKCRTPFTRIYGYCVASFIFMHLFINVGMTIGLMPVIGIPLPLMSYGGSSLWAFTILIFIFLSLYREEKKYF